MAHLPILNARVGIVIMDALMVFGLDLVPGDIGMRIEFDSDVPDQVLDEDRIFVSPFGDGLFVLAFQ